MKTTYMATLAGVALLASSQAALIGEYTFNDTGSGTIAQRMPAAMGSSSVAAGASLSTLGTNTTTQLDFAGFNNIPNTAFDGYGFGGATAGRVMFFHRAEGGGNPSAWGSDIGTGAATAPLSFTLTADATHEITVNSVTFAVGNTVPLIYFFQEAGGPRATTGITSSAGGTMSLDSPVVIGAGESKMFSILLNSGNFNVGPSFDNISVDGTISVIPEPAMLGLVGLVGAVLFGLRRFQI